MEKSKQIKNSIIYLLPVLIGNILPFITLPIFTRILSVQDYGYWALAQVYGTFVCGLANFGLTISYERNFFEAIKTNKTGGLLYTSLLFVFTNLLIFGIVTYIFNKQFSLFIIGTEEYGFLLLWSYCAIGITGLKFYFLLYFKNSENAKSFVKYSIDESVLTVLISLFFVVYLRIGIIGLVWGQLLSGSLIFLLLVIRFVRILPISIDFNLLKESLKLSLPLTPRVFLGVIGKQFDKYMVGLLNNVGGVGIYNIGQKVSHVVFAYMTAIENVFLPQVYKRMFNQGDEGPKSIGQYLTPFIYISIAFGILISLFSEELIYLLTPPSYHGAVNIVSILTLLYGIYFFGKIPQLVYAKRTSMLSYLSIFSLGLNVVINIPFISKYGAIGAAWGSLLSGLISGLITFIVSQYYYKIKWEYKKIITIFTLFFGSSLSLFLFREYNIFYGYTLVFKFLVIICYIYIGFKIQVITDENYQAVKSIFREIRNFVKRPKFYNLI